jgi:hypothetical protein
VLAREGGAAGDEVGGRALEDDAATVVTGAGAEVDIQSACAITAWWCSITITDLPESTRRSNNRLKTIRSIALASVAVPTVERGLEPIRSWSTIAVVSPSSRSTSGRAASA